MALAAALAITVCGTAPAGADIVLPEESVPSERVAATVNPALVRVSGTFAGWVRDRGSTSVDGLPFTVRFTCSGFGVHPDGYIATLGQCVDANDPSVRMTFIRAAAEQGVVDRPDIPLDQMIEWGRSAWTVEGQNPGSPMASEIRVTGIVGAPWDGMLARVVDDRPIGQGDVGLLKVDTTDMPTLELATGAGLEVGTRVLAAGYPESVTDLKPGSPASIESAVVDGTNTDGGRPVYPTDTPLEVGMGGGPALDDSGRVLGINSVRSSGTELYNFVVPISGFTELLGRNGVRAELGPRDLRYREALDAYFGGEYTDAIDAIDRLQQEGPTHPRVGRVRSDAEASRALHGDASENHLTQVLIWVAVGTGAIVIVAVVVLLVARRRRRQPVMAGSHPPFPGPQPGPPWQGGPGGPFPPPAWQPGPSHHQYGPPRHPRPAAPPPPAPAPVRPAPAAQVRGPFDGPTRQIRLPQPVPPSSENVTTTIAAPTPPGSEDVTTTIAAPTPPPARGAAPEGLADGDQAEASTPPPAEPEPQPSERADGQKDG